MEKRIIEKVKDQVCLVRADKGNKHIELCFYSLADALSYAQERKYESVEG
ncbi:hypothetical protein [Bacillus thermotolerans]|uniref:Uncharacterized protein n=1 Tax=Bacillus thermotolerans TaxID=1221996 RepID=A0A0F5I1U7_BACTR|nr:hypothetical protein [Bacillus thermotolerans]KKB36892.1 hypothetical protein QY97_00636 [Bacillus thermotolerans]KKB39614.1 hypothetical protein QY95_02244 [Bacillus thermotolerans]KKB44466.1 hypothetical protein QY96_02594 [Bacillus thermotolerans]